MIYATIFGKSFYRDGVRTRVESVRVHNTNHSVTAASKGQWLNLIETSDGSDVIFQKTAVAVVALLAAFLKTVVAVVMWLC